ncbi:MAG: PH domain-containing protein [Breznakia sp.]
MKFRMQINLSYMLACIWMLFFTTYYISVTIINFSAINVLFSVILFMFTLLIVLRLVKVKYILEAKELDIYGVFKKKSIPYKKMKTVAILEGNNSMFSLVKQQVEISYGKKTVLVSPKNNQKFKTELEKRIK